MKFIELCKELGLSTDYKDEKMLPVIAQWCNENVSQDLRFHGDMKEVYRNYMELATIYLDEFLPLLPREIDQCIPEFDGRNTVQEAAYSGLDRILSSLAPAGDILNQPNAATMTPLHIAAISGNFYTLSVLLSLGADANKTNKHRQLPIFSSLVLPIVYEDNLKENKIKIFRLLKESNPASVMQQDSSGDTVLHLMAVHGLLTLMTELLQTNPGLVYISNNHTHYPVHTAILNNQAECIRLLLQERDVATLADSNGWVPLHYAARYSGQDIVFLCCDVSTNLNLPDDAGRTPFMLAAEGANTAAMEALIARGALVTVTDTEGCTALHNAVKSGNVGAVSWLLEHTVIDVNAQDLNHQTALSLCEKDGNDPIKELLLAKGAVSDRALRM